MISMVHRDGDTTIQLVQIDDQYEVSLHQGRQGCVKATRYTVLRSAVAAYCAAIAAEVSCYVDPTQDDVPWYAATVRYAVGGVAIDPS